MSRNGSGTYTLPAGNPVVSGTTITTTWANTTLTDIANSLTGSVAADGQTPMTGALNMGNNKVSSVATPTVATDATTKAYVDLTQSAAAITGGTIVGATLTNDTIDSTPIGSTTPSTVKTTALTVTGATSGTLAIAATAIAGTNTATFPAATGTVMVSGNMPAFSAYRTGLQTGLASVTYTKIQVQTEVFDTNSNYDNATNYRFTPTIAGYYQINAAVVATGTSLAYTQAVIYKNGSAYATGGYVTTTSAEAGSSVSSLVYMNGSTDYVELYIYVSVTGTAIIYGGSYPQSQTFFNGSLIRSA